MPKETFFNLSEEKREKITRESIKEFGNQGFEKGNIGKIAKEASVSKGSMYQYNEYKKELYIHCIKESFNISMKYGSAKIKEHIREYAMKNHKDFLDMEFNDYEKFLKEITFLVRCSIA